MRVGHAEVKPTVGATVMDGIPQATLLKGETAVISRLPVERWWRALGASRCAVTLSLVCLECLHNPCVAGGVSRVLAVIQSLPVRSAAGTIAFTRAAADSHARLRTSSFTVSVAADVDDDAAFEACGADGLVSCIQLIGYLLRSGIGFREEVCVTVCVFCQRIL